MKTTTLFIDGDSIVSVGDIPEDIQSLGPCTRKRATEILPVNRIKRAAFVALRSVFGERGRVAEFTRSWQGPWSGRIFQTGETYVHQSRRVVIEWERKRLEELLCQSGAKSLS